MYCTQSITLRRRYNASLPLSERKSGVEREREGGIATVFLDFSRELRNFSLTTHARWSRFVCPSLHIRQFKTKSSSICVAPLPSLHSLPSQQSLDVKTTLSAFILVVRRKAKQQEKHLDSNKHISCPPPQHPVSLAATAAYFGLARLCFEET
jgi:hypothetical protein